MYLANPPTAIRLAVSAASLKSLPSNALCDVPPSGTLTAFRIDDDASLRYEYCVSQQANRNVVSVMKLTKHLAVVGAVAILAAAALAQTNPVNTANHPNRVGQVVLPEQPTVTDANVTAANLRPVRPERPPLPPEVVVRVERFKQDARAYLAKQEALKKQLQGANDSERAAIREQLKELRRQWLERAKELRKNYKERQAELADKLTEYRELLDNIRTTALRDAGGRTRRGDD